MVVIVINTTNVNKVGVIVIKNSNRIVIVVTKMVNTCNSNTLKKKKKF